MMIKDFYKVKKNWQGDPCIPTNMAWEGVSCSYDVSKNLRIVSLWVFSWKIWLGAGRNLQQACCLAQPRRLKGCWNSSQKFVPQWIGRRNFSKHSRSHGSKHVVSVLELLPDSRCIRCCGRIILNLSEEKSIIMSVAFLQGIWRKWCQKGVNELV